MPSACEPLAISSWSNKGPSVEVRKSIPGIFSKGEQSSSALRALALAEINTKFPKGRWTHCFTDGSAEEAKRNGGSGAIITIPGEPTHSMSAPSGKLSTNYRAESQAILMAVEFLKQQIQTPRHIVIFSDSMSVLQALSSKKQDSQTSQLKAELDNLAKESRVVLQWIPAHCNIRGNEEADRLAKQGGSMPQPTHLLSYNEARTIIKGDCHKSIHNDPIHKLKRQHQTTIFRLRTGHCLLRAHMKRIGAADTETCSCGEEAQTPEHVLQRCTLYQREREATWPHYTRLKDKLWGSIQTLAATATFIEKTGLDV